MSRNLYKTLQKEGTKRTDEDLVEAGADFLNCKGGARYAKTTNAIWMWHSLTQSWRKLYGSKYNDIENNWKALRESLSDTKIKSRKASKSKTSGQCSIEGVTYKNQAEACKRLNLNPGTISGRIRNPNFPDWKML